jgi:hypothetical protein
MTDISDLGLEVIINPIKKVRLQFHAGLWYVEYQRKPKYLLDGWWWFDDSKYPEYNDAYKRAIALAEQKGTKEVRHKTLIIDVDHH